MEETNIPSQLTYHEPEPDKGNRPKDTLYRASRVISAVFTPFMLPFVAFVLLFTFTYLRILPLRYKLTVLCIVYCFTILLPMLGIYLMQKSTDGRFTNWASANAGSSPTRSPS